MTSDPSDVLYLFAGVPVANFDSALDWYERLLGRPPEVAVSETEVMWQIAGAGWLYIVVDAERAGKALVTILVRDLESHVAELQARGILAGRIQTKAGLYRKAELKDPDGNAITYGEDLTGRAEPP